MRFGFDHTAGYAMPHFMMMIDKVRERAEIIHIIDFHVESVTFSALQIACRPNSNHAARSSGSGSSKIVLFPLLATPLVSISDD